MKVLKRSRLEELLRRGEVPPPPVGLAARLKEDMPERIGGLETFLGPRTGTGARGWLLAASLVATIGAGLLAHGVLQMRSASKREVLLEGRVASTAEGVAPPTAGARTKNGAKTPSAAAEARAPGQSAQAPADTGKPVAFAYRLPPPVAAGETGTPEAPEAEALRSLSQQAGRESAGGAEDLAEVRAELYERLQQSPYPARPEPPVKRGLGRARAVPESHPLAEEIVPPPGWRASPSTGGTAEPNDQPYGDVFFRAYGVNPFIDTEDDRLSTFGLDVDTGSYTVARGYLEDGHLPPPEAVRVEEFLNFFSPSYGDPPPQDGEDFALYAEGAATPFGESERYRVLRFGIRGREVAAAERKPAVLTFVVDVSGSMEEGNRLGLVKHALRLLLEQLTPEDRVALVVYADEARVVLEPTADRQAALDAIERLVPDGSTNAEAGLALGYRLAERAFRPDAINRLILCSDGVANVGLTGPASILGRIGDAARRGIELTAVGVGMGNYNDVLLEQLADRGNGRYAYVDSLDEARRIFVEELTGTLQTIAADAKVQVEFDPAVVARYRLLGYENRDIADERFRDDKVDAGEIGAGHAVTALYEVKLADGAPAAANAATLRLRYGSLARGEVVEQSRAVRVADLERRWEEASPALRLASLVAEFAEVLKASYWAREADLGDLLRRAQAVSAEFPGDARVAELAGLVGKAASLRPAPSGSG